MFLFKSCLWATAVVAALGLASRSLAKPPDLPINVEHTVTPEILPDAEWGAAPRSGNDELGPIGFIRSQAGSVGPLGCGIRAVPMPFLAHLSATQRQNFATTLLFGAHPLLSLVPTGQLVDLACDHPVCPVVEEDVTGTLVHGPGILTDLGLKCEIVPLPKDVHGSIEIGIGFHMNGAPTYRFLVTEFSDRGGVRKDETMSGCLNTLMRALMRDCTDEPKAVEGGTEEATPDGHPVPKAGSLDPLSMVCPFMHPPQKADVYALSGALCAPSVLENLQKLAEASELRDKGRRLADDGFAWSALKCFQQAKELCPGCNGDREIFEAIGAILDGTDKKGPAEPGCEEMEEMGSEYQHPHCGGCRALGVPGAKVMADGLLKACRQALMTGRYEHAADLARQAFALDAARVRGDGCKDCPCISVRPILPAVDPHTVYAFDEILKRLDSEEQEVHVYQKAIAKPYRETNTAPPGVAKGE